METVIYVDGAAGNDATFQPNDPLRPRKTMPVQADYGTSTRVKLSGSGALNGIRGARNISGKSDIIFEQWEKMPAWEVRGDKIVASGLAWTVDVSGGGLVTYKCSFTPESPDGICGVYMDFEDTVFVGQDPDFGVTYNGGAYAKAASLAACRAADQSWFYSAGTLYVTTTGSIDLTLASPVHFVHVCDCENQNLIEFSTCTNVSVYGLAAALAPTTMGSTGYGVCFTSCSGVLRVQGRAGGGRLRDLGAHGIGYINCASATVVWPTDIIIDGMRPNGTAVVWYATSGTYASNICVMDRVVMHARPWLKANGTAAVAGTGVESPMLGFGHDEGVGTRVPKIVGRQCRMVYTDLAVNQLEPVPFELHSTPTVSSGNRFTPSAYPVETYDLVIVNGTTFHHSQTSAYHCRPRFRMTRLRYGYGYNGRAAVSLGLSGSLGVSRYVFLDSPEVIVNTDSAAAGDGMSVLAVTSGNALDRMIVMNGSFRNIGTQNATNLRNWIDYCGRGDDCFEIIGCVFEHTASDPNSVYAFAGQDHSPAVGGTRSITDNVYKGVAASRYSQDGTYGSFAAWSASVDTLAVNKNGTTLFPFAGASPPNLGLDGTSSIWASRRQSSAHVPATGCNGVAYAGFYGAFQYPAVSRIDYAQGGAQYVGVHL